jgi:sulfite exporter TauE/SafE
MPLSEDEQRILQEIEAQFYATDPQLAQQVSETTLYRHAARTIRWAVVGFVAGFVVLVASFATSLVLGFAGFLAMLACAFIVERNVRKLGRAGLESLTAQMKGARLKGMLGDAGDNVRRRFKRGDDAGNN